MNKAVVAIVVLIAVLGVLLFSSQRQAKAPSNFKVTLVTPGAADDKGWNESAYKGLKRIESELGAQISHSVAPSPTNAYDVFRQAGAGGADIVIGHASEWYSPDTLKIAEAHAKTIFLISGSEQSAGNVFGVRFLLEDAAYPLGQLAALMTKSNRVACIGPSKLKVIESTFLAFSEGVKSVNPAVQVDIKWTDSNDDIAKAQQATESLIDAGADMIFHNANNGAPGVFRAVKDKRAQGKQVFMFGSNDDQSSSGPDFVLASAALDVPATIVGLAKQIKEGKFEKKAQLVGMPLGAVWIAYNKQLENTIPADVRKRVDETAAKLKSGELSAPRLK